MDGTVMSYPISDSALEADIAILGKKGGGKTFTAKGIVERLLDMGRRVLILDPLGVWAGLRTSAGGDCPGYPVAIFGGLHADMPLDAGAAVPMAAIIARENVPAVIDLSELSKGAQQSFLLAFLRELKRTNTDALTIVLEEADVFAPQQPMGDDSKALHSEIDWIARRGRFRGFRLITICQRPAKLSKDVLTQCATMVVHRMPAPQDQAAVKAWIDGNGDSSQTSKVIDSLSTLPVGEAWVWASEDGTLGRFKFPRIKTLDTSSTPKAGERRIEPKTLAQVDVSGIRAALREAQQAAGQPKTGRSPKISQVNEPTPAAISAAEQRGYDRGYADGHRHGFSWGASKQRAAVAAVIQYDIDYEAPNSAPNDPAPAQAVPRSAPARREAPAADIGAERKPLGVLARVYPSGMTEAAWAVASGFKRSGTWSTYKGRLRTAGRIEERGGLWFATEHGIAAIGGQIETMPAPGLDLAEFWIERIASIGPMMRALVAKYPKWITREDLGKHLGMSHTSGTFSTYLGRLRTPGLIEIDGKQVRASRSLMEG